MPTARPRHTITETDDVAEALDLAAARWPEDGDSRRRLLLRLVKAGSEALSTEQSQRLRRRRKAITETSGSMTGVYRPGDLRRLRDDWPA